MALPGVFGVFYYRSANPRTLEALKGFLPVPAEELTREFEGGDTRRGDLRADDSHAADAGARHFYISNLPIGRAPAVLSAILDKAGVNSELRN